MRITNLIQNTDEWRNFRMNGVGGSEIAAIMGIPGAYESRNQVLATKLGRTRKTNDFQAKLYSDGHAWEEALRNEINAARGTPYTPAVVCHSENDRLFSSVDGIDHSTKSLIEIKSTYRQDHIDALNRGEVWPVWMVQIQWALYITGYSWCTLGVVRTDTGDAVTTTIYPDTQLHAKMHEVAVRFLAELDECRAAAGVAPERVQEIERLKRISVRAANRLKLVDARIKELAEQHLKEANATRFESPTITIARQERIGSVDYTAIPELQGVDLDKYRKKPSNFVTVTLKSEVTKGE